MEYFCVKDRTQNLYGAGLQSESGYIEISLKSCKDKINCKSDKEIKKIIEESPKLRFIYS